MKLKHNGWVVVMDGERALFLRNDGDTVHCNLQVFREIKQHNPANRDQVSARPGRLNDSTGGHKSAVEETDWHRLAKGRFAVEIADRLLVQERKGRFEELILVAPPQVLGAIRKAIGKSVRDKIVGELDKDLTSHTIDEIAAHVLKQ